MFDQYLHLFPQVIWTIAVKANLFKFDNFYLSRFLLPPVITKSFWQPNLASFIVVHSSFSCNNCMLSINFIHSIHSIPWIQEYLIIYALFPFQFDNLSKSSVILLIKEGKQEVGINASMNRYYVLLTITIALIVFTYQDKVGKK